MHAWTEIIISYIYSYVYIDTSNYNRTIIQHRPIHDVRLLILMYVYIFKIATYIYVIILMSQLFSYFAYGDIDVIILIRQKELLCVNACHSSPMALTTTFSSTSSVESGCNICSTTEHAT